jgi:hypothetical protein
MEQVPLPGPASSLTSEHPFSQVASIAVQFALVRLGFALVLLGLT